MIISTRIFSVAWIDRNKRDAILFLSIRGILSEFGLQSSHRAILASAISRGTKFSAVLCFKPEECKQITTLFLEGRGKLSDPRAPPILPDSDCKRNNDKSTNRPTIVVYNPIWKSLLWENSKLILRNIEHDFIYLIYFRETRC